MDKRTRIAIIGASGLLGSNLAYCWRHKYEVFGTYVQHPVKIQDVDIRALDALNKEQLNRFIENTKPHAVINCAALTNIDFCEDHPQEARALNADLVRSLVQALASKGIKLFHLSTDNVFDGRKGNYTESDDASPVNVYGQTKIDGEREALKDPNVFVVRTNIFGWNVQDKKSLAEWCISELTQHKRIKGFTDAIFSSIREVIATGDFTLGQAVEAFEERFAAAIGVRHAIGVNSGTDALRLSL